MRIHSLIPMVTLLLLPRAGLAQTATEKLEDFLETNLCQAAKTKNCLNVLTNEACSSGCPRRGYNWTADATNPALRYRVDLHMSREYLKRLRSAAVASPSYVLRNNLSFGWPLSTLLYQQVQMYLHDPSARYYDSEGRLLPRSAVVSGNHTVDPALFFMVAFGNEAGAAQAMAQADFASWLLSVGSEFAAVSGRTNHVGYYLRLSERVFTSFAFRHDNGGVRNNKRSYRCFGTQYCYWFHSFVAGKTAAPQSVLNQNLHAIRDALDAHATLAAWRDHTFAGVPLPPGFTQHVQNLREYARGGLNQLAYGTGNAADPTAPPSLREFMQNSQNDPQFPSVKRYNAYYRFDLGSGPANGSTPGNVCHYHYHNLELLMSILTTISTNPYYKDDPDFIALYYRLLYGRSTGDTRSCNNRSTIPPSKKVMRGLPVPEFYYGGRVYTSWPEPNHSSFPYGHCADALWFQMPGVYENVPEAQGIRATRAFFDQAYAGCTI